MREGLGSIPLLSYKGSYLLAFFSCFFLFGSASVILLCLSTTFSNDLGTKLTAIWDLGGFSGEGRTGVGVVSKKKGVHMRKEYVCAAGPSYQIIISSPRLRPIRPCFMQRGGSSVV